jgi:hypothetical protein
MPSQKITIKRKLPFIQSVQDKKDLEDYYASSIAKIGSYFGKKGSRLAGKGDLSTEEVRELLPQILGVYPDEREFGKAVELYFTELSTTILAQGTELEIGKTIDNSKPLFILNHKTGQMEKFQDPINIEEYVKWTHAKGHPLVAPDKKTAEILPNDLCKFYIEDLNEVKKSELEKIKLADDAIDVYNKYKGDISRITVILTNLGTDCRQLTDSDKKIKFKELSTSKDLALLSLFIEEGNNEFASQMYEVQLFLDAGVLKYEGQQIVIAENNEGLGSSIREVALELNKKSETKRFTALKARAAMA